MPSRRQKGEIVIIRRTSVGDGWYEAERNGARGLIPMKFVRKVRLLLDLVELHAYNNRAGSQFLP